MVFARTLHAGIDVLFIACSCPVLGFRESAMRAALPQTLTLGQDYVACC